MTTRKMEGGSHSEAWNKMHDLAELLEPVPSRLRLGLSRMRPEAGIVDLDYIVIHDLDEKRIGLKGIVSLPLGMSGRRIYHIPATQDEHTFALGVCKKRSHEYCVHDFMLQCDQQCGVLLMT